MGILLWIAYGALAILLYTWVLYPLIPFLLQRMRPVRIVSGNVAPRVTVIIAAFNEAASIGARIGNVLESAYPPAHLEVLVVSDGSTDGTPEAAGIHGDDRVKVLHCNQRRGRAAAHNDGVGHASGDIVVFTDAETRFDSDFLRSIAQPFADPRVGCVSGELVWHKPESNSVAGGRSAYWKYEYLLRKWESRAGVLCLASGPCMAVRKTCYKPLAPSYDVDFMTPLDVIEAGYRVLHESRAIAYEVLFDKDTGEFRAEIRMVTRNLRGYLDRRFLIGCGVRAEFVWSLVSHKGLRWLTPFFQILLLASTALLQEPVGRLLLSLQIVFYIAAFGGYLSRHREGSAKIFRLPYGFCLANTSFLIGVVRAFRGRRITTYNKPL